MPSGNLFKIISKSTAAKLRKKGCTVASSGTEAISGHTNAIIRKTCVGGRAKEVRLRRAGFIT